MKYIWGKIRCYYAGHIWCSLALVIVICCVLFASISQIYLKTAFTDYLTDNTIHAEEVILDSITENIATAVKQITDIGYEAAIDDAVRQLAVQIKDKPGDAHQNLMMEELLNRYAHYSKWILGISISDREQVYYQYDKKQKSIRLWDEASFESLSFIAQELSLKLQTSEMPKLSVTTTQRLYPDQEQHRMIHISIPLIRRGAYSQDPMILTLTLNTEFLEQAVSGIYQSNEGVASGYLTDDKGRIVYHPDPQLVGMMRPAPAGNKMIQLQQPVGELGWNTCIDIDRAMMLNRVDTMYTNGAFMMIGAAVIVIASLILIIWRIILKPLRVLIQGIARTGQDGTKTLVAIGGANEVWQVASEFNEMVVSLDKSNREAMEHYQEKVLALKRQRNAEREALESQINAHFICNTINVINYEAIDAGNHKVSTLLKKLSNILRYTFDQKHQDVFFYQEIMWVEQYLYLQKTRFEELFDYQINFEPEIQDWPCRKLMLQPFVENSIIHGLQEKKSGGRISITGKAISEAHIRITIEDNGKGMELATEEKIQYVLSHPYKRSPAGLGIGITNVVARIYQYYGAQTSIRLENQMGQGCRFIFDLYEREGDTDEDYSGRG